ncbi:serine hydrolase [Enterococcus sp. RIT-PI-f]|uniref:serine hydrolase n=1 Tax=Enterococcus sp. RIT-PI-f TaxID=1690244 RepID=UPI0006B88EDC|nr:serine hydrolase [Enterococcus sp. RIT-PI-f]KPG69375.1 D-alanyl-D-alanine carboxypeptidase [Enterococcus sp. RIT-PI-f]
MPKMTKFGYSLVAACMMLFVAIGLPLVSYADDTAISTSEIQDFSIDAKAAFSLDFDTGKILYDQDGDTAMGIASITKIISLYLVAEQVEQGNLAWDDTVEISQYAADLSVSPDLSNVPLHQDVTYTVKDLYDASYIQSANAAIVALAEKIAGSESDFVDLMKEKVSSWGIDDAKLVNASGLNNSYLGENIYPGSTSTDENELSAKDVAIVARHLLQDFPDVLEITSTTTQTFGEGSYSPVEMVNWNWMLPGFTNAKDGVDGLKTGTTDLAGACFVGTAVKDGQRIITVVLNVNGHAENPSVRFIETGKLMDYSFDAWEQVEVLPANAELSDTKTVAVKDGKELTVSVALKESLTLWVRKDMDATAYTTTIDYNDQFVDAALQAPVSKDTEIGTVTASIPADTLGYVDESSTTSSPLVTTDTVEKANIFVRGWRGVTSFFSNLF